MSDFPYSSCADVNPPGTPVSAVVCNLPETPILPLPVGLTGPRGPAGVDNTVAVLANHAEFKRYWLGSFASSPTVDLVGNPLEAGANYFNTVLKKSFIWDGSAWNTQAISKEDFYPYALNFDVPPATSTFVLNIPAMFIMFAQGLVATANTTFTSPANSISDVWIKPDGTYVYHTESLSNYGQLPRHDAYLHLLRVQSSATKIQGVYMRRSTYPVAKRPAARPMTYAIVNSAHIIPSASVAWVVGAVTLGQVYLSAAGDYWKCEKAGTAAGAPTGPVYNEENNSGFDLVSSGSAVFSFRGRSAYKDAWRVSPRAGIQWYFAAIAAGMLASKLQTETKAFLKSMAFHCVNDWISGVTYEAGRKVAGPQTQHMVWEATTAGTTTGIVPFPSGAAVNSTCTDGTIVWRAIGAYAHATQKFFWYDTDSTMRAAKSPDSHDSYAACYVWAVWKYLKAYPTDTAWLAEASPHSGFTYQALIREIIYANLSSQINANNLTKTFQQNGIPFGGLYDASFLMDNCEVWAGYHAAWKIFSTYSVDAPYAATLLAFRNQIGTGIEALWEEGTQTYKYVHGLSTMVPASEGNALFYPLCMSQAWPTLWGVGVNADRKLKVFEYMEKNYPQWYARNDVDDLLACGAAYAYAVAGGSQEVRKSVLKRIETERLSVNQADLYVHDAAYYLAIRDNLLVPPLVE